MLRLFLYQPAIHYMYMIWSNFDRDFLVWVCGQCGGHSFGLLYFRKVCDFGYTFVFENKALSNERFLKLNIFLMWVLNNMYTQSCLMYVLDTCKLKTWGNYHKQQSILVPIELIIDSFSLECMGHIGLHCVSNHQVMRFIMKSVAEIQGWSLLAWPRC